MFFEPHPILATTFPSYCYAFLFYNTSWWEKERKKEEEKKPRLHFIENCFPNLFWNLFCLLPRQYLYYYFVLKSFYQFANTR